MGKENEEYIIIKKGQYVTLGAFSSLSQKVSHLEKLLHDYINNKSENNKSNNKLLDYNKGADEIINAVCYYFNLHKLEVLMSDKEKQNSKDKVRSKELVLCRKICYYFINNYYPLISHTQIAKKFGNRDRTTITHAIRSIKDIMSVDEKLEDNINSINLIIKKKLILNE